MADPVAAARNFLNALEKIPSTIDQYKAKNEVLEKEIPQLQEIAGKVWKKEDELKQLKSELAALDRKIQLELAPKHETSEGQEQQSETEGPDVSKTEEIPKPEVRGHDFIREHLVVGRPVPSTAREGKGIKL